MAEAERRRADPPGGGGLFWEQRPGAARGTLASPRRVWIVPGLVGLWIVAVLAIRLVHYGAEPVRAEAATTQRLAERLEDQGWTMLAAERLITDGSLTAMRVARGRCALRLVVLPPDPTLVAVVEAAWQPDVAYVRDNLLGFDPPRAGRASMLWQGARAWLAGAPPPSPFSIALSVEAGGRGCLLEPDLRHVAR